MKAVLVLEDGTIFEEKPLGLRGRLLVRLFFIQP